MTVIAEPVGFVDRLYRELKSMAVGFDLKPDQRINEGALAKMLGASRTPLREALNRLVAEGLLIYKAGQGFFCRSLQPKPIFDLYEARLAVETATVKLACARATPDEASRLKATLEAVRPGRKRRAVKDLVAFDEAFHLGIAGLSGNRELYRMLESINARIRFVRWIDMEDRRRVTFGEHMAIIEAIEAGDAAAAEELMTRHVARRAEQITDVVREGYSRIYIPENSV